jgi:hypothetical protein
VLDTNTTTQSTTKDLRLTEQTRSNNIIDAANDVITRGIGSLAWGVATSGVLTVGPSVGVREGVMDGGYTQNNNANKMASSPRGCLLATSGFPLR